MNHIARLLGAALLPFFLFSCQDQPFFTDEAQWQEVRQDLEKKCQLLSEPVMDQVRSLNMNMAEEQAMEFMYAYMPVGDMIDYSAEFHLANVRTAFQARETMPWGSRVPEKEFRHFVLPVRVNNEALDSSRQVFYAELKDRVAGLSMYDAILEVNHWCHEKAVYQPTDARTSSPLNVVKTAYGRCGEESTLLVAALRSVCIPARQVYTPRWAHTDDNHAWVEAWADGKWYFLGACEPEPVLNLAWFNDPVKRGLQMNTVVFGHYPGPEDVIRQTALSSVINVTGNYTDTATARVRVVDTCGKALAGVKVDFKIYNYAEFFTVATKVTDSQGFTFFNAGLGDMLVWASEGPSFGFRKLSFGKDTCVDLILDRREGDVFSVDIDVVPPVAQTSSLVVTDSMKQTNRLRLLAEDSIRMAYESTFYQMEEAVARAQALGMDTARLGRILVKSRGNRAAIDTFLDKVPFDQRSRALSFLEVLPEKDWMETPSQVLIAHFMLSPARRSSYTEEFYLHYVMNPRVGLETLTDYKTYFARVLPGDFQKELVSEPLELVRWVKDSIRVDNTLNSAVAPMTPQGVYRARICDFRSREIFFASVMRSMGIASRIDPETGKLQYALETGRWKDVDFEVVEAVASPQGSVSMSYQPVRALPDPKYYAHFTVSRYQDGDLKVQSYPVEGEGTWSQVFGPARVGASLNGAGYAGTSCQGSGRMMDTGYYVITSGTRLASGEVLARLSSFTVKDGQDTKTELVMRDDPSQVKVIGTLNAELPFIGADDSKEKPLLASTGRGYFMLAVLGAGEEPTNHALRALVSAKDELEAWGRTIVLLFPDHQAYERYLAAPMPGLPSTVVFGIDAGGRVESAMVDGIRLTRGRYPLIVVGDTFNRVVYGSQGYNTSFGDQVLRLLPRI